MGMTAITVAGTALSTLSDNVRLIKYGSGAKRGRNFTISHRAGAYAVQEKWFGPTDHLLEVALSASPSREENLSDLLGLFHDPTGTVTIAGTYTGPGSIQAQVEVIADPVPATNPNIYVVPLHNPKGVWEDVSASSNAGNPPSVTTTGDFPVDDMTLTFAAAGFLEHTQSDGSTSRITLESGVPASTVVDCRLRTVTESGSNHDSLITLTGTNPERWMRFEPNTVQSFTSNVSVTVSWRDKWRI